MMCDPGEMITQLRWPGGDSSVGETLPLDVAHVQAHSDVLVVCLRPATPQDRLL